MRKLIVALVAVAICGLAATSQWQALAAGADWSMSPVNAVKRFPEKGSLHNPYTNEIDKIGPEGHHIFLSLSCNGCHGGTGGGGMCPPLTNKVWVYGADDDTLFRLVTLGSAELQKDYGLKRIGSENVVGPMPAMGPAIKTSDDLWKIITWIRQVNPSSLHIENDVPAPPAWPE